MLKIYIYIKCAGFFFNKEKVEKVGRLHHREHTAGGAPSSVNEDKGEQPISFLSTFPHKKKVASILFVLRVVVVEIGKPSSPTVVVVLVMLLDELHAPPPPPPPPPLLIIASNSEPNGTMLFSDCWAFVRFIALLLSVSVSVASLPSSPAFLFRIRARGDRFP